MSKPAACDMVRTAADRRAVERGCYFDPAAAERVRYFFTHFLRHSKGQFAGQPFTLLPWQWDGVIRPLFGWKRPDGTRRFRRAGIWIPKKNGKSTLCAGISLYLLVGDGEPGAEVFSAAADRAQASIVFNEAASMVAKSPALSSRLEVVRYTKRVVYAKTDSFYQALSADVPTKEGLNIHGLTFDELHAQRTRDLWDTLDHGGASRRQPLFVSISTAGYDRDSIGYEQYAYAKGVLDGRIDDDEFFGFVAEAGPDDDWKDPAVWAKANPSFGVTVPEADFASKCKEAQNSPAKENAFRRYRLNQWTEQDTRWLSMEVWDACPAPLDLDALHGARCFGGLDLASTTDVAAFALYFPSTHSVLPFFWVPRGGVARRERENRAKVGAWVRAGLMRETDGDVIDYDVIRRDINELRERYDIAEVAVDRWNSTQLVTQLTGDGLAVIAYGQGYASMTDPTKQLEKLVLSGQLRHGGNPVLRWMAGNVAVEQDAAGNLKPSKKRSPEKIDGIVALIMAIGRALVDASEGGSVYESRGIEVIEWA